MHKLKTLSDNLATIGEPVAEKDQIFQLLSGFEVDHNPILAFLIARDDDIFRHSIHSILLTHEQ